MLPPNTLHTLPPSTQIRFSGTPRARAGTSDGTHASRNPTSSPLFNHPNKTHPHKNTVPPFCRGFCRDEENTRLWCKAATKKHEAREVCREKQWEPLREGTYTPGRCLFCKPPVCRFTCVEPGTELYCLDVPGGYMYEFSSLSLSHPDRGYKLRPSEGPKKGASVGMSPYVHVARTETRARERERELVL